LASFGNARSQLIVASFKCSPTIASTKPPDSQPERGLDPRPSRRGGEPSTCRISATKTAVEIIPLSSSPVSPTLERPARMAPEGQGPSEALMWL